MTSRLFGCVLDTLGIQIFKAMAVLYSCPRCRVHGLEIEGRDCGEAAAQWITGFLKTQPYRLVHFEPHLRPRSSHQILDAFRPTDQVRGASLGFGPWCVLWKAASLAVPSPSGGEACLLSSALLVCQAAPPHPPPPSLALAVPGDYKQQAKQSPSYGSFVCVS